MAFNFFGALGNVARVLPGYMQGYRTAIQDNWNDLNQYNQVWKGQLSNLYDEATFEPAVDMYNTNADLAQLNLLNTGFNTALNMANLPGEYQRGLVNSAFAPQNALLRNQAMNTMFANMAAGGGVSPSGVTPTMANGGMLAAISTAALEAELSRRRQQQPSGVAR